MMGTVHWTDGVLSVRNVPFDARLTLMDSAQVFHWREEGNAFCASVAGRHVRLLPRQGGFDLGPVKEEDVPFFVRYFDLDRDYAALAEACRECPVARRAMESLPGLRVLGQPAWETLLSFITSANNNVGRIRGLVLKLMDLGGGDFPSPEALARVPEKTLRALGFGYRAPYLIGSANMVAEGFDLEGLRALPYEEAHSRLCLLPGVGPKVADCVLLFGLGHTRAFPVAVWMERLMVRCFGAREGDKKGMRAMAFELFGEQAGLVQQYLFHCARLGILDTEITEGK